MAKYPPRTCRDCGWAAWTWSDKVYPEGKRRIIVQQPGTCSAPSSRAGEGQQKRSLRAQEPFTDCAAWKPGDH
jgi:hypothetical protein